MRKVTSRAAIHAANTMNRCRKLQAAMDFTGVSLGISADSISACIEI
jgi:hypothetical protein